VETKKFGLYAHGPKFRLGTGDLSPIPPQKNGVRVGLFDDGNLGVERAVAFLEINFLLYGVAHSHSHFQSPVSRIFKIWFGLTLVSS
jgi:hypothetical protein